MVILVKNRNHGPGFAEGVHVMDEVEAHLHML